MINITIQRRNKNDIATIGAFRATSDKKEGCVTGYTLEPPDKDNQRNISCIPPGEYKAYIRDKNTSRWDYDVIELESVPNRTAIQIHIGNYPKDTNGCILVGMTQGKNAVWQSGKKFKELMKFIGDEDIKILIKDCG